jgi:DNA mismatch endonuclease (patch repair protein)
MKSHLKGATALDIWPAQKRSAVMARVKSKGNASTEVALARAFRRNGVNGWRRHVPVRVAGRVIRPDFVFPLSRVAVFVDGCFWHRCPIHCKVPSTRRSFWSAKLMANTLRDRKGRRALQKEGWLVVGIWEHSLRRSEDQCAQRVLAVTRNKGRNIGPAHSGRTLRRPH